MKAFLLKKPGKANSLILKEIEEPKPKKNQVLIKHKTIGINYFDICFRNGLYGVEKTPVILGMEACGIIEAIGSEVKDFKVGERVAYATGPIGSYCQKRVIDQDYLICPPDNINDEIVAGSLLKGLMAHTLLFRVYKAIRAKRILIHAAAGGVGHLLCQWANHLGLQIIGTVGSDEKIKLAKSYGCDYVINYQKSDFLAEVAKVTKEQGVGIVYDSVGKDTLAKSIDCLWPMGICVSYGDASGLPDLVNINSLFFNSIYLTRPTLALYKSKRIELVLSANEVFAGINAGFLNPNITTYNFEDLPRAHEDLESRKTSGSLVIKV